MNNMMNNMTEPMEPKKPIYFEVGENLIQGPFFAFPAGTVVLLVRRDQAWDVRWVCRDMSTGSAIVTDRKVGYGIEKVASESEVWNGVFPVLLTAAIQATHGCATCKNRKTAG